MGLFYIFLFSDFQIVQQINGDSCTVQGKNSDVILHVPKGVYGTLLANIHTDPAKFIHHIPKEHCLVAPICEYCLTPASGITSNKNVKYKIQIPHIVTDIERVRHHIRIFHGNIHGGDTRLTVEKQNSHSAGLKYDINDKYVTIYTSHFSGFIVTAHGINCCAKNTNVLIFGSLRNHSEVPPIATVKIIFASNHIKWKDFLRVSIVLLPCLSMSINLIVYY